MATKEVVKISLIIGMLVVAYSSIFSVEATRYAEKAALAAER